MSVERPCTTVLFRTHTVKGLTAGFVHVSTQGFIFLLLNHFSIGMLISKK